MRKLTLYTAASLDGLIAGPNGELDWLDEIDGSDDYGFAAFLDTIDTTLSGTATYQIAADFTDDPYPGKTNYVFTRTSPPPADTNVWHFVKGDIVAFTRGLKAQEGAGIWLVGGGQINTVMLKAGLIDEIIVTLVPIVLGDGIPLFAPARRRRDSPLLAASRMTPASCSGQWPAAKSLSKNLRWALVVRGLASRPHRSHPIRPTSTSTRLRTSFRTSHAEPWGMSPGSGMFHSMVLPAAAR
jgi:dihydrofolate reductase